LPVKEGVAPNQPFSLNFDQTFLIRLSVISIIFLFICQFILSGYITNSREVSQQFFSQNDSLSQRTYVSLPFEITKDNCAADIKLQGNLNNSWLETDFTLVNETTGDQYYFSGALEYYAGYTDGESWSEGSNGNTLTVWSIKKR